MLNRRTFLIAASSMTLFSTLLQAEISLVPEGLDSDEWKWMKEEILNTSGASGTLGTITPPPNDASWKEVKSILDNAPRNQPPIKIAEYFLENIPKKYQMAWPEPNPAKPTYANPLILMFFTATRTKPSGDTTAWCAAFANWCIQRSGLKGTSSASSQSFLNLPDSELVWEKGQSPFPESAEKGDIAILTKRLDRSHGHVAFVDDLNKASNTIDLLGGNQIIKRTGIHIINTMPFSVNSGSGLEFNQIRRIA